MESSVDGYIYRIGREGKDLVPLSKYVKASQGPEKAVANGAYRFSEQAKIPAAGERSP